MRADSIMHCYYIAAAKVTFSWHTDKMDCNPVFAVNVVVQVADRASYSDVTRVSSLLSGSPPLWLTQKGGNYFVSGAKIIMRNLEAKAGGRKQRLHIIDEVLEPLTPLSTDNSQAFIDLTAGKLLREADAYRLPAGHSIR